MFKEKHRKEKFAKGYHAAIAQKEKAEEVKRDQLTSLLLLEDGGQNTDKARKALSIAKDNLELAERRVDKKLEELQIFIGRQVEEEVKGLDRRFEELKTMVTDQLRSAGVCVGQAEAFFSSLGPEYSHYRTMLKVLADDLKIPEGPEPMVFLEGYAEGAKIQLKNVNSLKSHFNKLKNIKIYSSEKDQYINKLLHRALREYK